MHARVVEAINRQINSELSASYSYLAMSAFCERLKFTGAARWLRLQSQEEYMHAMKLFDFVLARDENVDLVAIERPRIAVQHRRRRVRRRARAGAGSQPADRLAL